MIKINKQRLIQKYFYPLVLFAMLTGKVNAQIDVSKVLSQNIIEPSPTATSLGKYGEYPVSLYNGLIDISQNLLKINSGELSLNVSLSYHAGGNKPSDIPGWVGLGFSLNTGGVITRVVQDLPDDKQGGFYTSLNEIKAQMTNYVPNYVFIQHYMERRFDAKSDRYLFNFNGYSGEFMLDWEGNVQFLKAEPFKITIKKSSFSFDSFEITTEDGTVYTFANPEQSRYTTSQGTGEYYNSSWYLSDVKNAKGSTIAFQYSTGTKYRYKQHSSERLAIGALTTYPYLYIHDEQIATGNDVDKVIYLEEITFDNGKLIFHTSKRLDPYYVPNSSSSNSAEERKLDSIVLKGRDGIAKRRWELIYIENNERLKLKALISRDLKSNQYEKYEFFYNAQKLPISFGTYVNPFNTNSVDYWGYYNGKANLNGRIPLTETTYGNKRYGSADRTPSAEFMKAEILEKIVYPTGGYTIFEFEPNDYIRQGASFTEAPMVEYVWESSQFSFEDGYFDGDPATITFTLTQPTLVTVSKSIKRSGPNTAWFPGTETYETKSYTYGAGTYNLRTIFNTDQLTTDANSDVHYALGSVSWRKEIPISPNRPKLAGGLRIKSIRSFDGIKEITKTFEYKQEDSYSSGFLSMYPTFFVPMSELWPNMNGIYLSSEPINDTPEGPPVGYSRVVERFPDNSYTVHKFTTYGDYPDQENSFNEGTSNGLLAHLTSMNFMRGLENETIIYNANNRPLKRVVNEYEILAGASLNIVGVDIKPTFNFPSELSNWNGLYYGILTSRYAIPRRFTYKKRSYQISFDSGESNPLTTSTEYFYGNPKHVQPNRVIITKSDGGQEVVESLYCQDYATGTAFIDSMKNNHLIAYPIEQVRYKEVGTTRTILSGTITKYLSGGKGLVDQVLELETSQPISLSSFKFSNRTAGQLPTGSTGATAFSPYGGYKSRLIYSNYDAYGNARQVQPAGGPPVTYIWSYKGQYPVAEIKNASFTDIQTKLGGDQAVNTFTNSYPSDTDLRTKFNGIRSSLPNSALSYYTYDPLNGMTSATDPSGRTAYYNYDGFGRLKETKDTRSKTTGTYEYHYRQ